MCFQSQICICDVKANPSLFLFQLYLCLLNFVPFCVETENTVNMKCILLSILLLVAFSKARVVKKDTNCTVDINHYYVPSNVSRIDKCFVDIKCEKPLYPNTQLDGAFAEALFYTNHSLTFINEQGGCQILHDRNIFIAVNATGINLTSVNIPLSWSMVHEVNLSHNQLTILKDHSFGKSDIKLLDLSYNQIETIEEKAFENEDRRRVRFIATLLLQNNKLRDLKDVQLSLEFRLKFLDVSYNRIEDLSWLERAVFTELNTIKADYNLMTRLDPHFRYMNDLRKLSLVGNSIKYIDNSVLNYLSSLEDLDLSGNDIQTLQPEMFLGLHSLTYLNLSHNKIDAITAEYFMEATSLSIVDLSYNNLGQFSLAEGRSFAPIDYLVLNENNLTEEEIYEVLKFPLKVRHIHIGGNKFNCRHLIFRQAREMVHNNVDVHPEERDEDMEIDCTSGGRLEKFGVMPRQLAFVMSDEKIVVPNYREEEDFEILKKALVDASSALVEVRLTRRGEPAMAEYVDMTYENDNRSHMSVVTVTCVSVLVVLAVLGISIGVTMWKFYPNGIHAWRRLRGS